MSRHPSRLVPALIVFATVTASAFAGGRPDGSDRTWYGQVGTGFAFSAGDSRDFLDDGLTLEGGALFWPKQSPVGLSLGISYQSQDLSSSTIRRINDIIEQDPDNDGTITGGDVNNWQFSLNGIWSLGPQQDDGLYLIGGITYNRVEARVTERGLVYYPPICDPWFWWCTPGGVGPGSIVAGKRSENEFGWNLGAGYSFDLGYRGSLYIEARYQQINFGQEDLEYIPITFGYRW